MIEIEMLNTLFSRIFFSRITLVFELIVLILISGVFYNLWNKRRIVEREIDALKNEITILEGENLKLEKFFRYTQSSSYIEKTAKQKLNLKNEGEKAVVVEMAGGSSAKENLVSMENQYFFSNWTDLEKSNISKWWSYFFEAANEENL